MNSDFNPNISIIACFSSDFSFELHVTVTGLTPNGAYQLWTFYPNGEAIGGHGLTSNEDGALITQGGKVIVLGTHSSTQIQKVIDDSDNQDITVKNQNLSRYGMRFS